jgi:hypothetical protein
MTSHHSCFFTVSHAKAFAMNPLAEELDEKLQTLDPVRAKRLESLVREAMLRAEHEETGWPEGYFEDTAGAFADEEFERPPQGEFPRRETW